MYLKSDITQIFQENNYRSCIPIVAGFSGIEIVDTDDPITLLIKKLKEQLSSRNKPKRILPSFRYRAGTRVQPAKIVVQNWLNSMFEKLLLNGNKLKLDGGCSLLLMAFYECQGEIPAKLRKSLLRCPVVLTDIMFHHDIRNAMYLFSKLNVTNISKIDITNISKKKFPKNMVDMLKLYYNRKKRKKKLRISGGIEMELSSSNTGSITIQLARTDNNVETHKEFLLSAISLVDTIKLCYSLDNMYPFVRDLLKTNNIIKNVLYEIDMLNVKTPNHMKMMSDSVLMSQHGNINIDLPCKQPADVHIADLQPCIRNLKNIDIILRSCNLTDEHIESLQPCIPYLENLDISYNSNMSSQAMEYISDSVMKTIEINNICNLKWIYFGHCNLTDKHIESLQPCIPYLENLDISNNSNMSSQAMKYISDSIMKAIEINKTCNLKLLKLWYCVLTDEHIESLQPCIPYLENLDISYNSNMSSQAMKDISDSIMKAIEINKTCNLKLLKLWYCVLTDEHIESLQPCIPYLENLDISYNSNMSSQAMKYISDSIMKSIEINKTCNLKLLKLWYCVLTDEHIESLQPCIPYLENLDISYNSEMSSQAMKNI